MSDELDANGMLHLETVSLTSEELLVKLEGVCDEEAEANDEDITIIGNSDPINTEQGTCAITCLEIDFEADGTTKKVEKEKPKHLAGENETAPHPPLSPTPPVTILPNEDSTEKNASFNLVLPYGHDFVLEGQRAPTVLVANENDESDKSQQYENYDEWLSRINKQRSLRSVCRQPTSVKCRELRGRGQVSFLRTTTSARAVPLSSQINNNTDKVCVNADDTPATIHHDIVADVTRSHESQSRLVVRKPEQINEPITDSGKRTDHNYCGNCDKINNCIVTNINTHPTQHNHQNSTILDQVCTSNDVPDTLQHHIDADSMKKHESRPRLIVKNPKQINEETAKKKMEYCNYDKIKYCNGDNTNVGDSLFFIQNDKSMDQVCTSDDVTTALHHNVAIVITETNESRPKMTVKRLEEINELTLEKRIRIGHGYCGNANKNEDFNINNINISSIRPSSKNSKKVEQVIPENASGYSTKNQKAQPRLLVNEQKEIIEPSPEKRRRIDHKYCSNSDKTNKLNDENTNASSTPHSSQNSNKKTNHHMNGKIKKNHKSRPTPMVKEPQQVNEPMPEKIIRIDNNVCINYDIIKDCNFIDNNNISPTPHFSQPKNKNEKVIVTEITATLQHIVSNINKIRESRRSLLVEESKLLNKLTPKQRTQVNNYSDVDKTKHQGNFSVNNINGEGLPSDKDNFEWTSMDRFRGVRESFATTKTGSVASYSTIYDAFRAFWIDDILETIAIETNRYANSPSMPESFQKQWYDTNIHEILLLFTFWMMLGVVRMPTIKSCFSDDPLLKVNVFRTMFTKIRYENLVTALSFANNDDNSSNASELQCISPLLDHLNTKFQSNFIPNQNISIDESFPPWKYSQQVHPKNNTLEFGIKIFELCDNATGYLWSLHICTGKDERETEKKYNAIVLKLMRPLLNKGYTLYMKISLNSPTLARFLKKNKTDCVGTVAPSSERVPPIEGLAKIKPGQILTQHFKDVCVTACYGDKILYISTYHGPELEKISSNEDLRRAEGWKPQVVVDCDQNLGVVDSRNEMLEPYVTEKNRCSRWHIKLFKRLLNYSILNAQILLESSKKKKVDHLAAKLQLVDSILEKHLCRCPVSKYNSRQNSDSPPWRGVGHWPVLLKVDTTHTNGHSGLRCVYCFSRWFKDKKTIYKCEQCNVPLCVLCFKGYHDKSR